MSQKPTTPAEIAESQRKILEDAKNIVKTQAFYMKRALDMGKIMDALKHASNIASELRTSLLSPKDYYSLYMVAFDELRYLETYLYDERSKHKKKMSELYELVQYAGNIVPRLYLLVTVASAYIKSKEAPAKDILRDVCEMCKGVQNPTRGLFLRNYLSEVTKDKLPDVGCDPSDGSVRDSVDFVLANFTEMNKLWVRLHMGPIREREKRENERNELKILIGKNLSRLSQLDGVTVEMYKGVILDKILEQVVTCHDRLAQQYLMEIIIQVFPDEFHLATLDRLLSTCGQLVSKVDIKGIVTSLAERLSRFVCDNKAVIAPQTLYDIFERNIEALAHATVQEEKDMNRETVERPRLSVQDYLALQVALVSLCLHCYPTETAYVNGILANVDAYLSQATSASGDEGAGKDAVRSSACVNHLMQLLTLPVATYKSPLKVLGLSAYAKVSRYLLYEKRKQAQVELIRNAVAADIRLTSADDVTLVLSYITTLVKDEPDQPEREELDMEDFVDEQHQVAALVHLFRADTNEALFDMYKTARKFYGVGGKDRCQYTLPPLVFAVLRLAVAAVKPPLSDETRAKGIAYLTYANETINALRSSGYPDKALNLYLQADQVAGTIGLDGNAYEFMSEAMTIYEEDITGGAEQFAALTLIVGALNALRFTRETVEDYESLATKVAKHSLKLTRKPDQCVAVCMASHLFWRGEIFADGKRVLECLQKALKIANTSMNNSAELFVIILNQYLYYYEHKNTEVTVKNLSAIIALINTSLGSQDVNAPEVAEIHEYYKNSIAFIKARMASSDGPSYDGIEF